MDILNTLSDTLLRSRFDSRTSMADALAEAIRRAIIAGQIPPSFCFPNENVMCQRLGIGRTTIREAYKMLEVGGYITRSKRGTFVNDPDKIAAELSFSAAIEQSDFNDVIEFRSMLESQIAGIAAERATDEQIAGLGKLIESMVQHQDSISELTYYDTQFHMAVAEATNNKLIEQIMTMAKEAFFSAMYVSFQVETEENIKQAVGAHREILDAISRHDAKRARNAMFAHIQTIKQRGISPDK